MDLVRRLQEGADLNTPDNSTFYGGGDRGYIDYPAFGVNAITAALRAGA